MEEAGKKKSPEKVPFTMPAEAAGVTAEMKKVVPAGAVVVSFGKTQVVYCSKTGGYHKASYAG